jgi:hypothetical protein
MGMESAVTKSSLYDLFSVVERVLNVEAEVMGLNPGMNKEPTGSDLWTIRC